MLCAMSTQPSNQLNPVFACIISACSWGVLWYPLRLLQKNGVDGLWATLLIYSVAIFTVFKPCWQKRHSFSENYWLYFLLALTSGWTNLAFILAMLSSEVVRVLLLFYLSPIWAIIMARIILHEKFTLSTLLSLIIAITGALLMLWQDGLLQQGLSTSDIYALSSGFAFALTNIVVRKLGVIHWSKKIGAAWLGVVVISISGIIITQNMNFPEINQYSLLLIIFTAFPFMFVMTWMAQYGVTHLPIRISSIIFLLEILAGALSAVWLTNEVIHERELIGGIFIVIAGIVSVWKKQ